MADPQTDGGATSDASADRGLHIETDVEPAELRERLKSFEPWRYAISFSNGVSTDEFARGDWFVDQPLAKLRMFEPLLPDELDGGAALDVGCSIGHAALCLRRDHDMRVTGIDSSRRNIEIARYLAGLSGLDGLRYIQADASTFIAQEPVDLILHLTVLLFLRDPFLALRNTAQMLRSGGLLAIEHETYRGGDGTLCKFHPHTRPADRGKPWWSLGKDALVNMLHSSGYGQIELVYEWEFTDDRYRTLLLARRA